ncbi:reverse transcriptase domain-containing protein [Tanacetum coccineum]
MGSKDARSKSKYPIPGMEGGNTIGMVRGKGHRKRTYERMEQWMDNEISFLSVPRCRLVDSPIILEAHIEGYQVRRIYVDGGSSLEVMYEHCFRNLEPDTKAKLRESRVPLVGFSGEVNYPFGVIDLSVTMGEHDMVLTAVMESAIVKCHYPYNVLLGRTRMRSLGAVASTIHSMIKFPTANRITTMEEGTSFKEKQSLSEKHPKKAGTSPPPKKGTDPDKDDKWEDKSGEAHIYDWDTSFRHEIRIENIPAHKAESPEGGQRRAASGEKRKTEADPLCKLIAAGRITKLCSDGKAGPDIASRRLAKCAVELGAYDITYAPRNAIKGHVLADFLANTVAGENTPNKGAPNSKAAPDPKEAPESSKGKEEQTISDPMAEADVWKLYTDEGSSDHGSGAGIILIDPEGVEYSYAFRLNFSNSNNDAEYKALLAGLRIATRMKVKKMTKKYKEKVLEISHTLREQNKKADALSKLAAVQCEGLTKGVLVEELNKRSMDVVEVNVIVEEEGRT